MISNSEIRAKARAALGDGIFSETWLYAVLLMLVISLITGVLSFTYVGVFLASGLFSCATANYFITKVRGTSEAESLQPAVDGAKADLGGNIVLGILYNIFITLWTLLFFVPGIVKSCSYALAFYIKNDNPALTANEAISESRRMMDGYKMKYFLLQLSFIGWSIVGLLCLGVGTLWVNSYMNAATAVFYEEVKAARGETIELMIEEPASEITEEAAEEKAE